jgi:hypothetical protein
MTGAHMSRFSMATRLIRVRSSGRNRVTARLPSAAGANKSATRDGASAAVSGFTMSREVRPSTNQRHARTQKRRSVSSRPGRGLRRCKTNSCCRRQRLSAISSTFGRTAAAIAHRRQRNIHLSPVWDGHRLIVNVVNEKPCRLELCTLQVSARARPMTLRGQARHSTILTARHPLIREPVNLTLDEHRRDGIRGNAFVLVAHLLQHPLRTRRSTGGKLCRFMSAGIIVGPARADRDGER